MTRDRITDNELAQWAIERADKVGRLAKDLIKVRKALKPFADFATGGSFDKLPNDLPITSGSPMARRQVTAGDFKAAKIALGGPE